MFFTALLLLLIIPDRSGSKCRVCTYQYLLNRAYHQVWQLHDVQSNPSLRLNERSLTTYNHREGEGRQDEYVLPYIDKFEQKEFAPELLFEDKGILKRIENHPMAIWKCKKEVGYKI